MACCLKIRIRVKNTLELISDEGYFFANLNCIVSHKEIVNLKCLYLLSYSPAARQALTRRALVVNHEQVPAVCLCVNEYIE